MLLGLWTTTKANMKPIDHKQNITKECSVKSLLEAGKTFTFSEDGILSLKNLNITDLDGLSDIPDVETVCTLVLSDNKISSLCQEHFKKFTTLKKLFLARNKISTINDNTFCDLSNLQELLIHDNPLTLISSKAFVGLKSLTYLNFINKEVTTIEGNPFYELPQSVKIKFECIRNTSAMADNTMSTNDDDSIMLFLSKRTRISEFKLNLFFLVTALLYNIYMLTITEPITP